MTSTADQITAAALSAFYRQGFHATGVDQLSAAAGVTKRTLYRHFPGKDELIDAALRRRDAEFIARLRARLAAEPAPARPLAYLSFLEEWGRSDGFYGCAFINAAAEYAGHDARPHQLARAHKLRVLAALTEACGEAGLAEPAQAARALFVIGEGVIVAMQVLGAADAPLAEARAAAARALQLG